MQTLREVRSLRGFGIEWAEPGHIVACRRNRLYLGNSLAGPFRPIGSVPAPLWRVLAARSRSVQRALRFMLYNVLRVAESTYFVTFDRSIGVIGPDGYVPIRGWKPARVLRGGCAIGPDGAVYFGAYTSNPHRREIQIFRYMAGEPAVDVVHTFPAGSIRHVHGVFADPVDRSLWITTGDGERECSILRTADLFHSVEQVGGGDETWRCVSLQFTDGGVVYGMDAEFRQNWLFFLERGTGRRCELQPLEGPVYYSTSCGPDAYFAVTAELCPSQVGSFAALWRVNAELDATRIATFEKDWLSVKFFMPGTLDFPNGPGLTDTVLFRCTAVVPDNRVMELSS